MAKRRVGITGLGLITSFGTDLGKTWESLCAGRSGVTPITKFDTTGFDVRIASEVIGFTPESYMDAKEAKRLDPFAQYAVAGAAMAIGDAKLDLTKVDLDRVGTIVGSGIGGLQIFEEQFTRLLQRGVDKVSPFFIPKMMMNAAAGQISIRFGLRGPNFGTASACASANHAMGCALRTIQYGDADIVVTGGTEATVTPSGIGGFIALRALSKRNDDPARASRPFDKDRDGFVLGEGCGILVFEELEHARKRGARVYAEVLGFGSTGDAHHITAPIEDGTGASRSMSLAVKDAGLRPEDIGYINAHGTSTPLNDVIETRAIQRTFGAHASKLVISSTKSMIGHLLGASGAAELVVTALSLRHQRVHPTANLEHPDPECNLDYVPGQARDVKFKAALSNSFGFGGHNTTIALGFAEN